MTTIRKATEQSIAPVRDKKSWVALSLAASGMDDNYLCDHLGDSNELIAALKSNQKLMLTTIDSLLDLIDVYERGISTVEYLAEDNRFDDYLSSVETAKAAFIAKLEGKDG